MGCLTACSLLLLGQVVCGASPQSAYSLDGRRELFVDNYIVERIGGAGRLELHRPERREIVLETELPWEGNASGYQSVIQDGQRYRMYYRGGHYRHGGKPAETRPTHPWFLCYAESNDGIHWRKPELGLFEFDGSRKNNIVLTPDAVAGFKGDPAHTAVFLDTNPACPADARYKVVIVGSKPHGLYLLKSADGLHFKPLTEPAAPVITQGAFDSQNLLFWDPMRQQYRAYWRIFTAGVTTPENWKPSGVRAIRTAVSSDLRQWNDAADLTYFDSPAEHLYTNQIQPYYRAPQVLVGFPMRYNERGWSQPMRQLPGPEEREARAKVSQRYGTAVTDAVFMASRDGVRFHRWNEAFLRPGPRMKDSWVYGDNFVFWGLVETASHQADAPRELSLYTTEGYWQGDRTSFRRLTLRLDGFVSLRAPAKGGELLTRPFTFKGSALQLNASTSAAGGIQVEIQDVDGKPLPGFALADCPELFCDDVAHTVYWKSGSDVSKLAGKPVRLRLVLHDADIYAFQFVNAAKP